jgi:hypothetical protein
MMSRNLKIRIYKTIILPLILYGCEAWSLTLREEHRLKAFENRVLRNIFGPKRDEVTREGTEPVRGFTESGISRIIPEYLSILHCL